MQYMLILVTSFAIGFSGALMPGPLLGFTIDVGIRKGVKGGFIIALGHSLLDLVAVVLLMIGLKEIITFPLVTGIVGLLGGSILLYMGFNMVFLAFKNRISLDMDGGSDGKEHWFILLLKGASISISNPYYVIWWSSVGLALLLDGGKLGIIGIVLVYIGHIGADISWFSFVALSVSKGKKLMSPKLYRGLITGIGLFVCGFGLYFFVSGFRFIL